MISLESDKMNDLQPNNHLSFTSCDTFSNSIPNWTTFVKEFFWFHAYFRKWQNNYYKPNECLTFTFPETFSNSIPKWTSFVKEVFWYND